MLTAIRRIDHHEEVFAYSGDEFPYTQNPRLLEYQGPDLNPGNNFTLQSQLSHDYLRPDFEEEYKKLFAEALDHYFGYHYERTVAIIRSYLENLTPDSNIAATSSFKVLYHLCQIDTPCIFSGSTNIDWYESQHIEYVIAGVAECAREWLFHAPKDSPARKQDMDDFLLYGLNEICAWVPMPPVQGAVVTDIKVYSHYKHNTM